MPEGVCPSCGAPVKFCSSCGNLLNPPIAEKQEEPVAEKPAEKKDEPLAVSSVSIGSETPQEKAGTAPEEPAPVPTEPEVVPEESVIAKSAEKGSSEETPEEKKETSPEEPTATEPEPAAQEGKAPAPDESAVIAEPPDELSEDSKEPGTRSE